jgi:hypothetical protein
MGLLRLLTNPQVLPSGSYSIPRTWDISNQLFADRPVFFEYEPPELEIAWMNMMKEPRTGHSSCPSTAHASAVSSGCSTEGEKADDDWDRRALFNDGESR